VNGSAFFYTSEGWFSTPSGDFTLWPSVLNREKNGLANHHSGFRSARFTVHFPSDVEIRDVIFAPTGASLCPAEEVAKADSGGSFDWTPVPEESVHPPRVMNASPASAPGPVDCAEPFKSAMVTAPVMPSIPEIARESGFDRSATLIEVAIGADGSLKDAWVYSTSGIPMLDEAALRSARLSQYAAGRSFCAAAPGNYIFRAEFNGNG
jgi:Gram-negative bacterial TonB protein C-terminal